jgi:hypothetical protein
VDVVLPALLTITKAATGSVVRITGDAGGRDAVQVEAALARELDAVGSLSGASVEVAPVPWADAAVAALVARGAARIVLAESEPVLVHPPLLAPPVREGTRVVVRVDAHEDDAMAATQVRRELPRLLAALGPLTDAHVTLVWPGATEPAAHPVASAIEAIVAASPARVLLDDGKGEPFQVHPEVPLDQHVSVLGRLDRGTPPMVMLGIAAGLGQRHVAAVRGRLEELPEPVAGKRVLLVLRNGERDVPARGNAVLDAALAVVSRTAAATLVFRGADAHGRPYFEVVQSTLEGLPVGMRVKDPRA